MTSPEGLFFCAYPGDALRLLSPSTQGSLVALLDTTGHGECVGSSPLDNPMTFLQSLQKKAAKSKKNGGFTLIELMVAVAVIGILSGVALPKMMAAQDKAKASAAKMQSTTAAQFCQMQLLDGGSPTDAHIEGDPKSEIKAWPVNCDYNARFRFDGGRTAWVTELDSSGHPQVPQSYPQDRVPADGEDLYVFEWDDFSWDEYVAGDYTLPEEGYAADSGLEDEEEESNG